MVSNNEILIGLLIFFIISIVVIFLLYIYVYNSNPNKLTATAISNAKNETLTLTKCKDDCDKNDNCIGIQFDDKNNCTVFTADDIPFKGATFEKGKKFYIKNKIDDKYVILNELPIDGNEKYFANSIRIEKGKVYEIDFAPQVAIGKFNYGIYSNVKFTSENYSKLHNFYKHNVTEPLKGDKFFHTLKNFKWVYPKRLWVIYF